MVEYIAAAGVAAIAWGTILFIVSRAKTTCIILMLVGITIFLSRNFIHEKYLILTTGQGYEQFDDLCYGRGFELHSPIEHGRF
jgi:hypothetical protein